MAAAFFNTAAAHADDPNTASALTLLLVLTIHSILFGGGGDYGVVWVVLAVLIVFALMPPVIALCFSVWTATRPRLAAHPA